MIWSCEYYFVSITYQSQQLTPRRNRPKEYDTYRDPAGPLSASAQVLFGAIANFVTGIADVPTDVINDFVTAGRALGRSHERLNPNTEWRHRKRRRTDSGFQSNVSPDNEGSSQENERAPNAQSGYQSDSDEPLPDESDEDEDILSSNSDSNSMDIVPDSSMERRCSLQLEKQQTMSSEIAPSKPHTVLSEAANLSSKMSKKFVNLLIWLPTDLTLSLSKGFHNAPKLYHDPMVKATPMVHDVRSGFRAAGKVFTSTFSHDHDNIVLMTRQEFYDGFYYGVTGLVTQPRYGYKKKGTKGMIKGVGKGLGGVFLKPPAGMADMVHQTQSILISDSSYKVSGD